MYYPGYNYNAPEQAVVRAEQEARAKYTNQLLNDFSNLDTYFDGASVGFELNQIALTPYMSNMDEFSQLGKFTRNLGGASRAAGALGTGAGGLSLYFDFQSMRQGEMSESRFTYHLVGFGASVGVGYFYGNLPGAAVGGLLWAGETIYDKIIVPGINMVWQLELGLRTMHERVLYW